MAEPLKFTFDTAFGTRSENQQLNEVLPVITQDEVDAARTQGFIQGREDGIAEAKGQFNVELKASFEKISVGLDELISSQTAEAEKIAQYSENLALLIAQKIAKNALSNYPLDQIKALISECLSHVNLMPHLVIRLNQEIVQTTQEQIQPIIDEKGFEGKLILLGEENIEPGDCMIEWADGGVAHNTQEIIEAINEKLVDYFGDDLEVEEPVQQQAPANEPKIIIEEPELLNLDDDDIFATNEQPIIEEAEIEEPVNEQPVIAEPPQNEFEDNSSDMQPDELDASTENAQTETLEEDSNDMVADELEDNLDNMLNDDYDNDDYINENFDIENFDNEKFDNETNTESDDDFFDVVTKTTEDEQKITEPTEPLAEQNSHANITDSLEGQLDE